MGALNSIHSKLNEYSEANEEDSELSTPQRLSRQKCLMTLDPRSPTENIDRTPIIVEGTPNIHSTKAVRTRIPSHIQSGDLEDPRSPSVEFTRTPLGFEQAPNASSDTPLKAPVVDILSTPTSKPDDVQSRNVTRPIQERLAAEEKLCGILDESASSSENALTTDGSLEDSFDTAPLLEGTRKIDLSSNRATKKSVSSVSEQETETDDSFSSQTKLRCRQMNRIMGHQTSSPVKKVRSPLTLVENSPRVSKLPKKSLGGKNDSYINPVAVDKENVCH